MMTSEAIRSLLNTTFQCGIAAAQPGCAIANLDLEPPRGHTVVIGAGKAAAQMASALEARLLALGWPERALPDASRSRVVTRYGHGAHASSQSERIPILQASHPLPNAAGVAAALEIMRGVQGLTPDDLVLCLLSGGGSALLCAPHGVTLQEKIGLTGALLRCGAEIAEINTLRKHLSHVKGGRLAALAAPAHVISLIVSDVVGDDPSAIASGPTAPDESGFADALEILTRYRIHAPAARAHLERGARGELPETPKSRDAIFQRVENRLIVTNATALAAASAHLERNGLPTRVLSDRITGEARIAALDHALELRGLRSAGALLSGGETTVTVRGRGRGGRNLEFLLALALELRGEAGVYALAGDTDGIDGTEDAAGATIAPDTLHRAEQLGLNASAMLENNDAYTFFAALGDLVVTGPTGTNVNDLRCLIRV